MRFELMTSSLPRKRSTPELHWLMRAEDEVRTRDPQLGRLMLYRLSYFRKKKCSLVLTSCSIQSVRSELWKSKRNFCGERRIRTSEGVRQQIYSLPQLATLVSPLKFSRNFEPMEGFEPPTR